MGSTIESTAQIQENETTQGSSVRWSAVNAKDIPQRPSRESSGQGADIRMLNTLGLTESLTVGRRLSLRGNAYLRSLR